MSGFNFQKIYIDKKVKDYFITKNILKKAFYKEVEYIDDPCRILAQRRSEKNNIFDSKKTLLLTEQRGNYIKRCPGTKRYLCCNYYFLNFSTNCPLECSYCILQTYINNPILTLFVNLDKLSHDLDNLLKNQHHRFFRIGTGELTDSMALDDITSYSKSIIPLFEKYDNALLELKTKTENIDDLPKLKHNNKIVTSWSLNPDKIIKKEEMKTSSLKERLDAAQKCQKKGYKIGFHFDPIINYPSWEEDYREVIEKMSVRIDPKNIIWISLGGLRFNPPLKSIVKERFPKTEIFLGELIPCSDGKMRYLKPIRVEMYKKMVKWIKRNCPNVFIYFCMESKDVWAKVFGWSPKNNKGLENLFTERVNTIYK